MTSTVLIVTGSGFGLAGTVLWVCMKVVLTQKGYRIFSFLSPFVELWHFSEVIGDESDLRLKKRYSYILVAWWICAIGFFALFLAGIHLGKQL